MTDAKLSPVCTEERPCIPCFTGSGECTDPNSNWQAAPSANAQADHPTADQVRAAIKSVGSLGTNRADAPLEYVLAGWTACLAANAQAPSAGSVAVAAPDAGVTMSGNYLYQRYVIPPLVRSVENEGVWAMTHSELTQIEYAAYERGFADGAEGIGKAVFIVLEGFNIPTDARKILETAYYATRDTATRAQAPGSAA